MSILPSAQQMAVLNSKADVTFVSCSAGAGATTTQLLLGIESEIPVVILTTSLRGLEYAIDWFCEKTGAKYNKAGSYVCYNDKVISVVDYAVYKQNTHEYENNHIVFDYLQSFPKDALKGICCKKLTMFSCPTLDEQHPAYKMALNRDRGWIHFENGFPCLSFRDLSLLDVFGEVKSFSYLKMSYLQNEHLMKECPSYAQSLNALPFHERKRLKGYWSFEDVVDF